jgi:hypothetical protein
VSAIGARLTGEFQYGDLRAMRPGDGDDAGTAPDDSALVNMGNSGSNPESERLTGWVICVD